MGERRQPKKAESQVAVEESWRWRCGWEDWRCGTKLVGMWGNFGVEALSKE